MLILFPLLISAVGPASAACMIPRLGPWSYYPNIYGFSETRDELSPVNLDLSSPAAASWNVTGMDPFVRFTPVFGILNPSQIRNTSILWPANNVSVPTTLYAQTERPLQETSNAVYTASTSIQNIALSTVFGTASLPWVVEDTMDAFSSVSCPSENRVTWEASNESLPPPSLLFNTTTIGAVTGELDEFDAISIRLSLGTLSANVSNILGETTRFIDLPGTNATGIAYFTADINLQGNAFVTLHPCTATLGWRPADLHYTGQALQSRSLPDLRKPMPQIRPTYVSITSVREMRLLPTSATSDGLRLLLNPWMIPSVAPFALSVMLTITLSTASGTISSSGMAICNTETGYCGDRPSTFKSMVFRYGYGYGTDITSVRISLAILMLYCSIALVHTGFTIYTGRTSTVWDSISECVALAMGSRKPVELHNTYAGIDSARVFEHKVRIAATDGEGISGSGGNSEGRFERLGKHLELIFPSCRLGDLSGVLTRISSISG